MSIDILKVGVAGCLKTSLPLWLSDYYISSL